MPAQIKISHIFDKLYTLNVYIISKKHVKSINTSVILFKYNTYFNYCRWPPGNRGEAAAYFFAEEAPAAWGIILLLNLSKSR